MQEIIKGLHGSNETQTIYHATGKSTYNVEAFSRLILHSGKEHNFLWQENFLSALHNTAQRDTGH